MTDVERAGFYDIISDPAKRLAHEGDFLLGLLELAPGNAVLDMAAATGAHAEFLARHGARVTARDIDAAAIEYARGRRSREAVVFEVADMRAAAGGPFDLAIVMGNSLSMLASTDDVSAALGAMRAQLGSRGVGFVHVVNYEALERGGPRHKVSCATTPLGEVAIVKSMLPEGPARPVLVSFAYFLRSDGGYETWGGQSVLQNLRREVLEDAARRAGFRVEATYGDYDRSLFDPVTSPDLLLVLRAP